jgi:hypothetical protein
MSAVTIWRRPRGLVFVPLARCASGRADLTLKAPCGAAGESPCGFGPRRAATTRPLGIITETT